MLCGPVWYVNAKGEDPTTIAQHGSGLSAEILCFGTPALNAKLFRRDCLLAIGGSETGYAIAGDRALLLRLMRTAPVSCALDQPLIAYRRHTGSLTLDPARRNRLAIHREHIELAQDLMAVGIARCWQAGKHLNGPNWSQACCSPDRSVMQCDVPLVDLPNSLSGRFAPFGQRQIGGGREKRRCRALCHSRAAERPGHRSRHRRVLQHSQVRLSDI